MTALKRGRMKGQRRNNERVGPWSSCGGTAFFVTMFVLAIEVQLEVPCPNTRHVHYPEFTGGYLSALHRLAHFTVCHKARNVRRAAALADGARMPYIGDVTERGNCGKVCASSPSSLFFFIQLVARSTSPADSASPRSAPRVSPEKGAEPTASHRQTRAAKRSILVTRNIPVPDTPPQFAPIRRCDCPRRDEKKLGSSSAHESTPGRLVSLLYSNWFFY
ncbi:hypothetical protein B0H14DRAFT_3126279 [Mycena olivaceomarginata]|nr:hypothetical protein B0H14DRAFT_3126279 [Mycena olivaceomarginata]